MSMMEDNIREGRKTRVYINGVDLINTYGLHLLSYTVGAPVPDTKYITIPGRMGKIDATKALNGRVNYVNRSVSFVLHTRNRNYSDWMILMNALNVLFSDTVQVVFSTEPGYFYRGRFTVAYDKTNPVTGKITVTSNEVFPYKLTTSQETSNWTFDPEDFSVSQSIDHTLGVGTTDVSCEGLAYNGTVTIYMSSGTQAAVMLNGGTYMVVNSGKNVLYDMHIPEGNNTLSFLATGGQIVRINFERGIL